MRLITRLCVFKSNVRNAVEHIVKEELRRLWSQFHSSEDRAAIVTVGMNAVNLFRPPHINSNDYATILSIGIAMLASLKHDITGRIPDRTFEDIANCLVSTYGIGLRRGKNKVDGIGMLIPFKRRMHELQEEEARKANKEDGKWLR